MDDVSQDVFPIIDIQIEQIYYEHGEKNKDEKVYIKQIKIRLSSKNKIANDLCFDILLHNDKMEMI